MLKPVYQFLIKIIFYAYKKFKLKQNTALNFFFLTLIIFPLLIITSCNTTEPPIITPPPPDLRKITLTIEDASCTEVWLRVKADSITLPAQLTLKQYNPTGDSLSQIFVLNTQDSVLYIDSLNPNQAYNYQAVLSPDTTIKSENIIAQTLEPTSHNFTWQTFEFGEHSSSVLYDVAIIDENNIWAVGEIYMNDSLGNPDSKRYNAAFWNGIEWTVQRIQYFYQGQPFYTPIYSIYAFSNNDIWFCGNGVIHWNGSQYIPISIPTSVWGPYNMNKLWGSNSSDLYVVGNEGNIAHYDGSSWTRIESGTILSIYDIWGDINPTSNEYEIIALASDHTSGNGTKLLKINGTNVENISTEGLPLSMDALWFKSERIYYALGDGFYTTKKLGNQWVRNLGIPTYYKTTIRGTNFNNIFLGGTYGLFMHFNGIDWKNYQFNVVSYNDFFSSIDLKPNLVCAVGANINNKAIIYLGVK